MRQILTARVALLSFTALACASAKAQTNYYFAGDGSALTASKWSTNPVGPFTTPFVANSIANFGTVNGTGTGGSITVAGINATENFSLTAVSGTISNASNGVIPITVAASRLLDFSTQAFTSSGTAGYIKNGDGILAFAGNTYGGGFTLNAGTVVLRGVNALGSGGALVLNGGTIAANATRDLTGKYAGGITIGGTVTLGSSVSPAVTGSNLTFSNAVALGSVNRTLNVGGDGTYTFTAASTFTGTGGLTIGGPSTNGRIELLSTSNPAFSGGLTVTGGEVRIAADLTLGAAPGAPTNNITIDGGRFATASGATFTLNANRTLLLGSTAGTSISTPGAGTLTYNGVLSDLSSGGILVKQGGGTLVLGSVSTYTGSTSINNGTLQLAGGDNRLPAATTVNLGQAASANLGILNLNGQNQTIAGLTSTAGTNAGASKNTVTSTAAATLTLSGNGSYVYSSGTAANSGTITGAISIVKAGTGTQTFGEANTYTGTTTISGGTLLATNATGSATGNGMVTTNGGVLGGTGTVGAIALTSGTLSPGSAGIGTLTGTSLTWTTTANAAFELGATSDQIALTNAFNNTGSSAAGYQFAFSDSGATAGQTYTLATFAANQTNFADSDFGIAPDPTNNSQIATGSFNLNPAGGQLTFTFNGFNSVVVPEPSSLAILLTGGAASLGLIARRRK